MSKPSKRPQREDRDIHAAIREAAATLAAAPRLGLRNAAEFPEVAELLAACRDAVAAGVPRFVLFRGRNYWLRARVAVDVDIFDSPTAPEPLLQGAAFSAEAHGHRPGH
jgi:hypothetical protein